MTELRRDNSHLQGLMCEREDSEHHWLGKMWNVELRFLGFLVKEITRMFNAEGKVSWVLLERKEMSLWGTVDLICKDIIFCWHKNARERDGVALSL